MSDKQERNSLSGTIACTSNTFRCFGVSGRLSSPICNVTKVARTVSQQKPPGFGWSEWCIKQNTGSNGHLFPACTRCRKASLIKLGLDFPKQNGPCTKCANWDLLPTAGRASLNFLRHDDYPTKVVEGSPVPAPDGRDIFGENVFLPFLSTTWGIMKQACKFAFYQANRPGRGNGWTKKQTVCYLRYCGVSNELGGQLHEAAINCRKAKQQDTIDYSNPIGIGTFTFPAVWLSTHLQLADHIEAAMHQLFLGIAKSNLELTDMWLASPESGKNLSLSGFRNALQALIKDLRPFNLSWLAAYPLTGQKGSLGTGSWVSENFLFLVRVSQFVYGWCAMQPEAKQYGANDMSRFVMSYVALVSRLLTHGGVTKAYVEEIQLYMKEFMSAVHEFDVRVRHKYLDGKKVPTKNSDKEGKAPESFWMKANYMSLPNLLAMLLLIGPLTLWWDGGGKGERFIQLIKPLIKNGIREDVRSFFVNPLDRWYQTKQLSLMETTFGLASWTTNTKNDSQLASIYDVLEELADALTPQDVGEIFASSQTSDCSSFDSDTCSSLSDDSSSEEEEEAEDAVFGANETYGMTKKRTIYIYRNERELNAAVAAVKPLAGIVEVKKVAGETAFEFQTVFRKPVKQFARRGVTFNDATGLFCHGLWCANIALGEDVQCTTSFTEIQAVAKLSAVALPLWYIIGKGQQDSNKYCVITNWWKYRMQDGWYRLPNLDASLYGTGMRKQEDNDCDSSDEDEEHGSREDELGVRFVDDMEVAAI